MAGQETAASSELETAKSKAATNSLSLNPHPRSSFGRRANLDTENARHAASRPVAQTDDLPIKCRCLAARSRRPPHLASRQDPAVGANRCAKIFARSS